MTTRDRASSPAVLDVAVKVCAVALCPALPASGSTRCALHRDSDTAAHLGVVGRPCIRCRRAFLKLDFVSSQATLGAFRHAACTTAGPVRPVRLSVETLTPLFSALADEQNAIQGSAR